MVAQGLDPPISLQIQDYEVLELMTPGRRVTVKRRFMKHQQKRDFVSTCISSSALLVLVTTLLLLLASHTAVRPLEANEAIATNEANGEQTLPITGIHFSQTSLPKAAHSQSFPPPEPPHSPTLPPLPSPPSPLPHLLYPRSRCRASCPPEIAQLHIAEVRQSSDSTKDVGALERCVDGSRMTFCLPRAADAHSLAWISLRLSSGAAAIDSVAIFMYRPFDSSFRLSPYGVWAGDSFGARQVECALRSSSAEPTHGGIPAIISCGGVRRECTAWVDL